MSNLPSIYSLDNGLKIVSLENNSSSSVCIQLRGKAGSNYESTKNIGSSHILEHLLLYQGGRINPRKKLLQELTGLGVKIIGVTSRDDVLYGIKTPPQYLEKGIELLSKIFYENEYSQSDLDLIKPIIIKDIVRHVDSPEKYIKRIIYRGLYKDTRIISLNTGTPSDVEKVGTGELLSFETENYLPGRFCLCIIGNHNGENMYKMTDSKFSQSSRNSLPKTPLNMKPVIKKNLNPVVMIEKSSSGLDYVKINFHGYTIRDSEKYPAAVLACILDSYLKSLLRIKAALSYDVNFSHYASGLYGFYDLYFSTDKYQTLTAIKKVLSIFSGSAHIVVGAELQKYKNRIISTLLLETDKNTSLASYYSELALYGSNQQNLDYEINRINDVTYEDLQRVFKNIQLQKPKVTVISSQDNHYLKESITEILNNS